MSADKTLLDQIKDDVAKEMKYRNFWIDQKHFDFDMHQSPAVEEFWKQVCEKYATAKAQASCEATLRNAAENAKIYDFFDQRTCETRSSVDKSSILDRSNITIV